MLKVLSLGAGVQSSTLALMAARDEFERPDCAIFADTGAEPRSVYAHLDWLEERLPFPLYRVSRGDLRQDCIDNAGGLADAAHAQVPAYTVGVDGRGVPLTRQCTRDYKIDPISRKIRELLGVEPRQPIRGGVVVERWIGISTDEAHRMKSAPEAWAVNRWPLIEREFSRATCLQWLAERQYPRPPKSACVFCPYHSDEHCRVMRQNDPESFAEAVAFDHAIRGGFKRSVFAPEPGAAGRGRPAVLGRARTARSVRRGVRWHVRRIMQRPAFHNKQVTMKRPFEPPTETESIAGRLWRIELHYLDGPDQPPYYGCGILPLRRLRSDLIRDIELSQGPEWRR